MIVIFDYFLLPLPIFLSPNIICIQGNEAETHSLKIHVFTSWKAHLPSPALADGFIYQNHSWFQFSACLSKHVQLCRKGSLHNVFCSCNLNERVLSILPLKSNNFSLLMTTRVRDIIQLHPLSCLFVDQESESSIYYSYSPKITINHYTNFNMKEWHAVCRLSGRHQGKEASKARLQVY